jgi:hypothetical protein
VERTRSHPFLPDSSLSSRRGDVKALPQHSRARNPRAHRGLKPAQNRHSEAGDGFLIHSHGIVTLLQHSSQYAPRSLTLIPLLQAR